MNGTRVSSQKPHVLQQGDLLRLGVPMDSRPVEFEYTLVHQSLSKVKDFLTKSLGTEAGANAPDPNLKISKRKFDMDETEPGATHDSKCKLYRSSTADKSRAQPCPSETKPRRPSPPCSQSEELQGSSADYSDSSQQLATLRRYNNNLRALKERMGAMLKQAAELEAQEHASPELQEQMKVLQSQLNSQQEMALQRVEMLEKSVSEGEQTLEVREQICTNACFHTGSGLKSSVFRQGQHTSGSSVQGYLVISTCEHS